MLRTFEEFLVRG